MGLRRFLKKARKVVGKGLRGAVSLAAASGLTPAGVLAPLVMSKIQSAGEARNKRILKEKAVSQAQKALSAKGPTETKLYARSPAPPSSRRAAGMLDIKLADDNMLGGVQSRQKRQKDSRVRTRSALERAGTADKAAARLTPMQRQVLADQFKAENPRGTPAEFRAYLTRQLS